jgi:uncharacterized protein (DUF2236 family)
MLRHYDAGHKGFPQWLDAREARHHALPQNGLMDDVGYFGPDSVTWRIHGDPAMLVGGLRALLLQACHPRAMAAFLAHSNYQDDPWGRLQRTGEYVSTVTYGSRQAADRIAARVRGRHRRIPAAVDELTGASYRVDDPDLLLWVHCTEIESFLTAYRRCGGALDDPAADRYVDEQRVAARLIGIPDGMAPGTVGELAAYFERVRPELRVTAEARLAALRGFVPAMPLWVQMATPARPLWAGVTGVAVSFLPRWARRLYGLPGLPVTDMTATVTGRALRSALLAVPESLRENPQLHAARQRLAS